MKDIDALLHVDRIYANQASWLFAPPKLNWGDQVVLITGGQLHLWLWMATKLIGLSGGSGIGALLAETLAMRNVTVIVLTKDKPKYEVPSGELTFWLLSARADPCREHPYIPL